MRRFVVLLLDLSGGLALVAVAFLGARWLLQSRTLVFAFLPLVCLVGFALGLWRGRGRTTAGWLAPVLLNLPLAFLVWYTSRSPVLVALPILGFGSSALGILTALRWKANRGWIALLLVAANVGLVAVTPRFADSLIIQSKGNERPVPFRISLVGGGAVSDQQLRGHVVVVTFWATWCVPCHHELPQLERVYERFERDPRVAFFAVDFGPGDTPDVRGDTPERAMEFFRRFGYRIPLAYDSDGSLARALSAHGLPNILVLDSEGHIRHRHAGFIGSEPLAERLSETIEKLLPAAP